MAPGLNTKRGPFGPSGVMDGRHALLHQRLVVVAQRARAGVRGRAADHVAAEVRHDHHADVAVDRRTDEEA